MVQVITLKLTTAEIDVLDWLVQIGSMSSRSEALRYALMQSATRDGVSRSRQREVAKQRKEHPVSRRATEWARLVRVAREER